MKYRALGASALERAGKVVPRSLVGDFITSLEIAGASVTVTRLDDELRSPHRARGRGRGG